MLKKAGDWILGKGYRLVCKDDKPCPKCWEKLVLPEELSDAGLNTIVHCHACGWRGTIDSLASTESRTPPEIEEKPADSLILAEEESDGRRLWRLPAARRFNFLLGFAIFWNLLVSAFTIGMAFSGPEDFSGFSKTGAILFMIPFWLAGAGALISGLWMALASQVLIIEPGGPIISERRFLGFVFRRMLELTPLTYVLWVVAYQENDDPVYTLEIGNSKKERTRLSSQLSQAELGWMAFQLRQAIGQESDSAAEETGLPVSLALEERKSKTLTIQRTDSHQFEIMLRYRGWFWVAWFAVIFLGAAGFLAWESYGTLHEEGDSYFDLLNWPFVIVPGIMSFIFGVIGFSALGAAVWLKGRKRHFLFRDDRVIVTTEWRGKGSEESYAKREFDDVRVNQNGTVNSESRFNVKLVGAEKALTICGFREGQDAALISAWVRHWLDDSPGQDTTTSFSEAPL